MRFANREDAGNRLAARLRHLTGPDTLVIGLPRGGVPVAARVASLLDAPLDVWVVRKVGAPSFPEFGLGAVAEGGAVFLNRESVRRVGVSGDALEALVAQRAEDVRSRAQLLRGSHAPPDIEGRTVIVVDDGVATGGTMHVALQSLRALDPGRLVLAVPVAATDSLEELTPLADEVVCLHSTRDFNAVGNWYDDFGQTPTEEVRALLASAPKRGRTNAAEQDASSNDASDDDPVEASSPPDKDALSERDVSIPVRGGALDGSLVVPPERKGLVIFAHGSGSSRLSVRNRAVASALNGQGLATLLVDLLTPEENEKDASTEAYRFDLTLLARRLVEITRWARSKDSGVDALPLGYFGSSTGAAAALLAAGALPNEVSSVVSRGGRVDLATGVLDLLRTPVLLMVGGRDHAVLELNRAYAARLMAPHALTIIPGAGHLFEETGALEQVCEETARWFLRTLAAEVVGVGV